MTVIDTDGNGRLVETKGVCRCAHPEADVSSGAEAPDRPCETEGCPNLCRYRFCLDCSSARQDATERRRLASIKGLSGTPMPSCACGVMLTHRLARTCPACKAVKNREYQTARNAERRGAA